MSVARLLLVDDEPNVLATMEPIFSREGYEVLAVGTAGDAQRALSAGEFDVVVTDLRLPDGDGLGIVETLQREHAGTPAIVLTGFASLESAVEAMHRGAFDYLLKPCDVEELKKAVARAVAQGRLARGIQDRVALLERVTGAMAGREQRVQHAVDEVHRLVEELDTTKRELQLSLARERATVARLRELDELKSEFISNVSHELRTPLTSIRGYSALLSRLLTDADASVARSIGAIGTATDQLHRLVEDLLDMAVVEAGRLRIDLQPVDLRDAVRSAIVLVTPMAEAKGIAVSVQIPDELPPLRADPMRLGQVLNNLLSNAVKYTPEGGRVGLDARQAGETVHVTVSDTGVGIPAEEQPMVFSRFFHASTVPAHQQQGLGLGLAITRAIVEAHAGIIWLESEVGRGTTVHFTLPIHPPVTTA